MAAPPEANAVRHLFDHVLRARGATVLFPEGARVLESEDDEGPGQAAIWQPGTTAGLRERAERLRGHLRPGAPVLVALPGSHPLPAMLARALRGAPGWRAGGPRLNEMRASLGAGWQWRGAFALGSLLPGPDGAEWAAEHPGAFGLLAIAEELTRRWPILRALGETTVLEGERRP
jgi:hypothetical protein